MTNLRYPTPEDIAKADNLAGQQNNLAGLQRMTRVELEELIQSLTGTIRYLTPVDLSDLIKVPEGTIANWRCQGSGPPYTKIGKRVRYSEADVIKWINAKYRDPAAEVAA
ncbi:MAG: helix-turn-helix domain-containing protein [Roseobacter sp.]|uniref:helix-turn-helix transcriptional regulator n=1 Tax=Tateyamaria sp. TaxID=1929288 RepID=UPI00327569BE